MAKNEEKNVVTGAWCNTGGGIQGANCPEIWQPIKKGRQKFCGTNRQYFRGHPRTSLALGIQQPLHATDDNEDYIDDKLITVPLLPFTTTGRPNN